MASLVKELVEAGIHFGHRSTNWNPKMSPYIFGKRNKIHIIDVKETIKGLLLARKFVTKIVASGKDVLFVGTKRQARSAIERYVPETGMHYVIERWLGGTLTNFRTIRERLKRLEELERLDESGEINSYSKKMESQIRREKNKILRNLTGIRRMSKMPGAMVVVDVSHELNAVREARSLNIPTICLIDTDSDPDYADIPIPGNDDAMRAIEVVVRSLCAAVMEGKSTLTAQEEGGDATSDDASDGDAARPRRSSRAQFRFDDSQSTSDEPADQTDQKGSQDTAGPEDAGAPVTSAATTAPSTPTSEGG